MVVNLSSSFSRVFAVDEDEGINAQLFYNVTSGDNRFTIDESGMISVTEPLKGDEIAPLTIQVILIYFLIYM